MLISFFFSEIDFRFEKMDFFSIIEFWFCASLIVLMLQSHYVHSRSARTDARCAKWDLRYRIRGRNAVFVDEKLRTRFLILG